MANCGVNASTLASLGRRRRQDNDAEGGDGDRDGDNEEGGDDDSDDDNFNYMFLRSIADELNNLDEIGAFQYGQLCTI